MAINKVTLGENTLIDLSGDTVSADKLAEGYTAHDKTGNPITGTMTAGGISINGRTETRYANGNISAGDFVSSLPYSHSVDVEGEYNFGDKVRHDTFGVGVIVGIDKSLLTIAFEHPYGIKKLIKGHKSIKKI